MVTVLLIMIARGWGLRILGEGLGPILNGATLPWYLIGVLTTALLAVFYAMMRGKIVSRSVVNEMQADLRAAAERDREVTMKVTASLEGLQLAMARNQEKLLGELQARMQAGGDGR